MSNLPMTQTDAMRDRYRRAKQAFWGKPVAVCKITDEIAEAKRLARLEARERHEENLDEIPRRWFTSEEADALAQVLDRHPGMTWGELIAGDKSRRYADCRAEMYLVLHDEFDWKYPVIGLAFNKDRNTVKHAIRKTKRVKKDLRCT